MMELKHIATAGTLESSDIMVTIEPRQQPGLDIHLESTVLKQFGEQIRQVIDETVAGLGISSATITAVDKGALDCTVRARVKTALYRACDATTYQWEVKP